MRVLVAGASGKTGRRVLQLALERGDEVTALVRRPGAVDLGHAGLRVVGAEVAAEDGVLDAVVQGHDLVVSAIGSRLFGAGSGQKITARAHRNLAAAAERTGIPRFATMFAYGSGASRERAPLAVRVLARTVMRADFVDLDAARSAVTRSTLDWTIAYFGALTDEPQTGRWTADGELRKPSRYRISRGDVAEALLTLGRDSAFARSSVVLSGAPAR